MLWIRQLYKQAGSSKFIRHLDRGRHQFPSVAIEANREVAPEEMLRTWLNSWPKALGATTRFMVWSKEEEEEVQASRPASTQQWSTRELSMRSLQTINSHALRMPLMRYPLWCTMNTMTLSSISMFYGWKTLSFVKKLPRGSETTRSFHIATFRSMNNSGLLRSSGRKTATTFWNRKQNLRRCEMAESRQ